MPTTSTQRPEPEKKKVPVKWRDNAWCPLITVQRSVRRLAVLSVCGLDAQGSDISPRHSDRAVGRARRPLRPTERMSLPGDILPGQRSRFFNTSRWDTSSEL